MRRPNEVVAEGKRELVDPLHVVHEDRRRGEPLERPMRRLEDADRLQGLVFNRDRSRRGHTEQRVACLRKAPQEVSRGRQGDRPLRLEAVDGKRVIDLESATRLGDQPALALPGIADHEDGSRPSPALHDRGEARDRLELRAPSEEWPAHWHSLLRPSRSPVPVEPSGAEQQPCEPSAEAPRVGGWIHGPRMELLDDRPENLGQRVGQPAGEIEFFAGPFCR
jgi:hypothetical protein